MIVDNLCNSKRSVLQRVGRIAGRMPTFHEADVRDRAALRRIFAAQRIDAVIHFAGLKAVGNRWRNPLRYYDNNIAGTVALCEVMAEHEVKSLVFSSSATVYGDPHQVPIREEFPLGDQPVWPFEADGGGNPARCRGGGPCVADCAAALFQSGRRIMRRESSARIRTGSRTT